MRRRPWICLLTSIALVLSTLALRAESAQAATTVAGYLDSVTSTGSYNVKVTGWAFDQAQPGVSSRVDVYVGAAGSSTAASLPRPDVAQAYGLPTSAHGFTTTVVAAPGSTICVYALDAAGVDHLLLGCRQSPASVVAPIGHVDHAELLPGSLVTIAGWAFSPLDGSAALRVDAYVGSVGTSTVANLPRQDVQQAYGLTNPAHGFSITVRFSLSVTPVCVYAIDPAGVQNSTIWGCFQENANLPEGSLDTVARQPDGSVLVSGWSFDLLDGAGPLRVDIYVGTVGSSTFTGLYRPDVPANTTPKNFRPSNLGFSTTVPAPPGATVCVYAMDGGNYYHQTLGCRTV